MDGKLKTEYQHYIPQFLLRNFSHPYHGEKSTKKQRRAKRKQTNTSPRIYPGEPMLNAINLDKDPPELVQIPVKRTFGQPDIYENESKFNHQEQIRIEEKLSRLESAASKIINKINGAHKFCESEVWISRLEKDTLRKFLFVMKYRGPIFFRRFNHQKAEDYNADDKFQFLEYMRKENFKRPLDVWFHNLTAILDAKIDPEGQRIRDLGDHIYPGDAMWLYMNVQTMYLVLCTPSNPSEEFIVTENAFSIHEGRVGYSVDPVTGETTMGANTEFHVMGVISPSLMMLLRSWFLPEAMDDSNEELRKRKKERCAVVNWPGYDPGSVRSLLEDLPVIKARSSHIRATDGRLVFGESEDGVKRSSDMFCFTFFGLPTRHMQMLNAVMLDQAHHISTIVFQNRAALRKALEYYLDMPTQTNGGYSMKTCSGKADDPMLLILKKLEHAAQLLGSNVKAKYHTSTLGDEDDGLRFIDALTQMLDGLSSVPNNPFRVCMGVLLEGLTGLELNITDIHANYLPDFPDLVFAGIQEASQGQNNQLVPYSASIPRTMWRLAWNAICAIASEESGENESLILEAIRNEIAEFNDTSSQRAFQLSRSWPNEALVQPRKELHFQSSSVSQAGQENSNPNHASLQESMSRSNIGPRKAFNQLGMSLHQTRAWLHRSALISSKSNQIIRQPRSAFTYQLLR
jgi:hypothetical protein